MIGKNQKQREYRLITIVHCEMSAWRRKDREIRKTDGGKGEKEKNHRQNREELQPRVCTRSGGENKSRVDKTRTVNSSRDEKGTSTVCLPVACHINPTGEGRGAARLRAGRMSAWTVEGLRETVTAAAEAHHAAVEGRPATYRQRVRSLTRRPHAPTRRIRTPSRTQTRRLQTPPQTKPRPPEVAATYSCHTRESPTLKDGKAPKDMKRGSSRRFFETREANPTRKKTLCAGLRGCCAGSSGYERKLTSHALTLCGRVRAPSQPSGARLAVATSRERTTM